MKKKEIKKICKSFSLKPVEDYQYPFYPTKEVITNNRGLLLEHVPSSWLKTGASAAAFLIFAVNSHSALDVNSTRSEDRIICNENEVQDRETVSEKKIMIAPLFIHGEGVGATGCVVITPPVFLSEADACEVIATTLEKEGIVFDKRVHVLENIYSVDEFSEQFFKTKDIDEASFAKKYPFYFDLYSTDYNLGIKFISRDNYDKFAALRSLAQDAKELRKIEKTPGTMDGIVSTFSSVQEFDMIEVSQRIRECLREYGDVNAVFFYDPMVNAKDDKVLIGRNNQEKTRLLDNARQLLTQQVEDFGRWFRQTFKKSSEQENRQ